MTIWGDSGRMQKNGRGIRGCAAGFLWWNGVGITWRFWHKCDTLKKVVNCSWLWAVTKVDDSKDEEEKSR